VGKRKEEKERDTCKGCETVESIGQETVKE
jgi:hypothetical protein